MTLSFFKPFNDLSDFGFYKPSLTNIGIQSLIIFDLNGLPIYSRLYGSLYDTIDDNDILILTAFITSIKNYVATYTEDFFTDFGTGSSRYYLKTSKELIFCVVMNEIVFRRTTGESNKSLIEYTLIELTKAVYTYYNTIEKKFFNEMNYLENFVLQIDTILFYNFKKASEEMESISISKKHEFDNFKVRYSNKELFGPINHQLLIKGITGLIIYVKNDEPIVVRDYALEKNYDKNVEYYSGMFQAIQRFSEINRGVLTDFGLGTTRVLIKRKSTELTICLFISEVLYWRITGEILNIFMELTLKDILRSFPTYLKLFMVEEKGDLDEESKSVLSEQIDLLLLENAKGALKELNY